MSVENLVKQKRFYVGRSIYSRDSGLLVVLHQSALNPLARRVEALERDLRTLPALRKYQSSSLNSHIPSTSKQFLLYVLSALVDDFSIDPQPASWLGQDALFLPCECPEVGVAALTFLAEIADFDGAHTARSTHLSALDQLESKYYEARKRMRVVGLNQTSVALGRAALDRGIPASRLVKSRTQVLVFGQGTHRQLMFETASCLTSVTGQQLQRDKSYTKLLLSNHGVPVALGSAVNTKKQLIECIQRLGYPVVLKPLHASKGRGVHAGIYSWQELEPSFEALVALGSVLVERHIVGSDYRFLVVDGRCVAVARRDPPAIIGDGIRTVAALIDKLNREDFERGLKFEGLRERVLITEATSAALAKQGLTLSDVPKLGQRVLLSHISNISCGGTPFDVTDVTHPDNIALAERCARLAGIDICGVDFICPHIECSHTEQATAVLELNITPGLRPHLGANSSRNVADTIIQSRFAAKPSGRVPTVAVTGSVGKTTTVQLTAHILAMQYETVARSTTQGAWIGRHRLGHGDVAGGRRAQILLQDPTVNAGVFELSRGGLLKHGTCLDQVDIGILLNVFDNHLGFDGVRTREQLLRIKRLVVDMAQQCAIINADDPLCLNIVENLTAKDVALISLAPASSVISNHRSKGGWVAWLNDDNEIKIARGAQLVLSLPLVECPISLNGAFRTIALNIMAAGLASLALNIDPNRVIASLKTFKANQITNENRNVLTYGHPYTLFVSHADGAFPTAQLAPIARAQVNGWCRLVLCSAANRSDDFILQMGEAAQGFDDYIITESPAGLRGRELGDAPELLKKGLLRAGVTEKSIRLMSNPKAALAAAETGLTADDCLCHNLF